MAKFPCQMKKIPAVYVIIRQIKINLSKMLIL